MALLDPLRRAVGRTAARLQRFAAGGTAPAFPGVGIQNPTFPTRNVRTEQRLESAREDVLEGRIAVNAGPYSDRVSTYPGSHLDPTKIDRIFRSADFGVAIYEYADLCAQMRQRDAHLMGIDRQRRQSVANKPFLLWPRHDNDPLAVGMAHALRAAVDGIDAFPSATYSALSKNCDGWSLNEIIWKPGKLRFQLPDGNGGGPMVTVPGIWPRAIHWVHAKHTQFTNDSSDEPLLDLGPDGSIALPRSKFVYTMTPGDGIACARGYSRAVVWMHFFKHADFRDWNVFLHLYGIPFLQGKIERPMWNDPQMRAVLEQALMAYGKGEQAPILPNGLSVEVHDPVSLGGAGDAHKSLFGICNAEQSKAVQGETLTTEPGESGSYKLGNVHQDSQHEVTVGDALSTASDYRRDLLLAIIEENADEFAKVFNVKPDELVLGLARCGFRTDREWSPEQRMNIYAAATKQGIEVSESQVRNEMQLDRPTSPNDIVRGEAVVVPNGGAAVGSTEASDGVRIDKQDSSTGKDAAKKPDDNA
jgi:phage gp29-like protein